MGPQYLVKHKAQDSLKLLKMAGYDLEGIDRVTIFNIDSINRLLSKLFDDAAKILKDGWATLSH